MGGGGGGQTYATYEEAQAAADAANAKVDAANAANNQYNGGNVDNYQPSYPVPDPQPQPAYPSYPIVGTPGLVDSRMASGVPIMGASRSLPSGVLVAGGLPAGDSYPAVDPMPQPAYPETNQ